MPMMARLENYKTFDLAHLVFIFSLAYAAGQFLAGRFGSRVTATGGGLLSAACTAAMAIPGRHSWLLLLQIGNGLGQGCGWSSCLKVLGAWFVRTERGAVTAWWGSTEHPISISHASGHVIAVNSYVLKMSGVTKETKDPPGGSFDRDPDGMPNGVIREAARSLLTNGEDNRVRIPPDQEVQGLLRCFREYAERGITSVGIAGGSPASLKNYQAVRDAGNPVRVNFMFSEGNFREAKAFEDNRLRSGTIKVFHGNSMSGRTCWLSEPYSDRPDYFGIPPSRPQDQLDRMFQAMHDAGWQIATHSNGDREIEMVLTAIERAQAKNPRPDACHRIEHASVMNQSLLDRAKKDGVILVFHSYMWEHGDKLALWRKAPGDGPSLSHLARHGDSRGRAFRLHGFGGRSIAADSGHGHAQGIERSRLRTQSASERGRSDQGMDRRRRIHDV